VGYVTPWEQETALRHAVREGYEKLEEDMEAVLREWEAVRAAYRRVEGSLPTEPDRSGEWEALQETSDHLVRALDEMLRKSHNRLPDRVSWLRGKVIGFSLALNNARRRRHRTEVRETAITTATNAARAAGVRV
jgi:hypothetical protein